MLRFHFIDKVNMIGATEHKQLPRRRRAFKQLADSGERRHDVAFSCEIHSRNITSPLELQFRGDDPRLRLTRSGWRKRHNRANPPVHFGGGKRGPTAEAISYNPNARGIE